ncbi:cyclase family protein [Kordiimonas pumila]|uniref:Cyclase family protein n=1 Tax=Kordiimonas pumila TaxID=2161677 RepID=A0ABV7D2Y6_9PROT|nr:cyclase family protein [Kordiimonas pumila]
MPIIDLSHTIQHGQTTYKGLPPVHICDYLSREESKSLYAEGTSFQIDMLTMVGNSGTYIDSPFHRYADGDDLSTLALETTTNLPALVIRAPYSCNWHAIDEDTLDGKDFKNKAVLFDTGWSKKFGSDTYMEKHPFLTKATARALEKGGAVLVGIDSHNIDDIRLNERPVHSILLKSAIPIVEHLTNLSALPDQGFKFYAAPLKIKAVGTFPTRAYAIL